MVAEGYKKTEIGVIPVEWDVVKLGSLGNTYSGLSGKTKEDFGSGSPYITYMNVFSNNSIDATMIEYVNINSNETQNIVQNGDIFFTVSSETKDEVGMTSVLLEELEEDTYMNSFCFGFRLHNNEKLLPRFAKFLLREHNTRKRITFYGAGTTRINISKVKLMDLLLPLPPLKEQEKIADILCSADDKIDTIASQIEKAETLKKGLLQKLLSEGIGHSEFKDSELGKIPESWETNELEKATTYVDYRGKTPTKTKSGIFLITARNIKGNKIDYSLSNEYIAEKDYETVMSRGKPQVGDVLLTTEAPLGQIASIDKVYVALAQRIIKYRGVENYLDNSFLKHYFISSKFQDLLLLNSTGSTVKGIKGSRLKKLKIAIPPLKEQKQIADILSTADEKLEVLRDKKQKYETLKKGLLQKLLSGEIRV